MKRLLFLALVLGVTGRTASAMTCEARPAVVTVDYDSDAVRYNMNESARTLSGMRSDTVSPYDAHVRTETEGLRRDRPVIDIATRERIVSDPSTGLACIGYKSVDVHIGLHPIIFIAREWPDGPCRDAIFAHERKHIAVDHQVTEEFVPRMRSALMDITDMIGTPGPVPEAREKSMQNLLEGKIRRAMDGQIAAMHRVMERRQQGVDSLEEYERVGAICGRKR